MDDLGGFAGRRNVIEPAARTGSVLAEFQDARGEGIVPAEIVEEPAVQLRCLERFLNVGHTFGWCWIGAHDGNEDGENNEGCQHERTIRSHTEITAALTVPVNLH